MIYLTAHTINYVCHCIRTMFRVLGVYNFAPSIYFFSIVQGAEDLFYVKSIAAYAPPMFSI